MSPLPDSPAAAPAVRCDARPDPREWEALRARDPASTFFHQLDWLETYARHHEGRPLYLTVRADGRLVGGLLAVRFQRGPVHYLESLPMGTYGGPIVDRSHPDADAIAAALLDRFIGLGRAPLCLRVQCVMRKRSALTGARGFSDASVHVTPLDRGFEHFWTSVFPMNRRNECNRAQKRGVDVRLGASSADVEAYMPLHREAHGRWGLAAHPEGFLQDLARMENAGVLVFVVHHEGVLLGAHFTFVSGDELVIWHGVTRREDSKKYFPSSMLVRAEAEEACRRGLARLNLGGSGGRTSIENFKRLVGGEDDLTAALEREKPAMTLLRRVRRRVR